MDKKLNILIIGYGKMGKEVESVAIAKGHRIIHKISDWESVEPSQIDVAVDFSIPETALENIHNCIERRIPLVIGTTGWYEHLEEVCKQVEEQNASVLWASNFSLGVNIFFRLNEFLAETMSKFDEYKAGIHEIHHTQKLDAPSGTAISLAKDLIAKHGNYQNWKLIENDQAPLKNQLPITYERQGEVKGTHIITYDSDIDRISIKHEAKSRKGFAIGALMATEWIIGKKGFFNMKDVLGF